jgi:capsular polysaccharide transport system permease protein
MSILRKIPFLFLLMVVAPVALSSVYYYKHASPQYTTEAHYIIRGTGKSSSDMLGMLTGMPGLSASAGESLIAQDYILSRQFLSQSKQNIDIKSMFTREDIDWWASLRPDLIAYLLNPKEKVSEEDLLAYWQNNIVNINYDSNSGITVLQVTAFKPEDAVNIAKEILRKTLQFINTLSNNSRSDALSLANAELQAAKLNLDDLREKIAKYGDKEQIVIPQQRVIADQGIITELRGRLVTLETEQIRLNSFMQPTSPEVRSIRAKIYSLKQQIAKQEARSKGKRKTATRVIQKTNTFKSELEFAEQIYLAALSSYRAARLESNRKQQYLDVIVQPQLPDESLKPDKLLSILSVFFTSFMLWGIVSLLLATVKDHIGWV